METLALTLGVLLILSLASGVILYLVLGIAVPVCRLLDWEDDELPEHHADPHAERPLLAAVSESR